MNQRWTGNKNNPGDPWFVSGWNTRGPQRDWNADQVEDLIARWNCLPWDEIWCQYSKDPNRWTMEMKSSAKKWEDHEIEQMAYLWLVKNCEKITKNPSCSGRPSLWRFPVVFGWSQVGHCWTAMISKWMITLGEGDPLRSLRRLQILVLTAAQ